jgi:hypothetical protein
MSKLEEQVDDVIADKFAEDVEPRLQRIRREVAALAITVNGFDSRLKALECAHK